MISIIHEPYLSERTTLRLGGKAIAEVSLSELNDFEMLDDVLQRLGGRMYILGAGSNILAADDDLPLVLVRAKFMTLPHILNECGVCGVLGDVHGVDAASCVSVALKSDDASRVLVRVGAGVRLPRLLGACAKWGLSGLEGLCGIPGTVGGAVTMNAGSFGDTVGERLESVQVYTKSTGVVDIARENFECEYRKFSILGMSKGFFVLHATFSLTSSSMNGIKKRLSHNFLKKKSTQPVRAFSAGCVFKNPPNGFAGMMLDSCGFKGRRKGGMFFSPLHANFLINDGSGCAAAAFDLLEEAREAVWKRFSVRLESEVKILQM